MNYIAGFAVVGVGAAIVGWTEFKKTKPKNKRFHTMIHELEHSGWKLPLFDSTCGGQIGSYSATIVTSKGNELPEEIKVSGLACEECGHVSANRLLPTDSRVEDKVWVQKPYNTHQRDTKGFLWITRDEIDELVADKK